MIFRSASRPHARSRTIPHLGVLLAVAALLLSSCGFDVDVSFDDEVGGSGDVITQSYDNLDEFDRLSIEDGFDAVIEVGPETGVVVQAHENFFEYIEVAVRNDSLVIKVADGTSLDGVTNVTITMPTLVGLDASGSSDVDVTGVASAEMFSIDASGASDVTFDGVNANAIDVGVSGASDVTLGRIATERFTLAMSGASDINASGQIKDATFDISGSSDADFDRVDADQVTVSVSGASDVDLRNARRISGELSGASGLHVDDAAVVDVEVSGGSEVDAG